MLNRVYGRPTEHVETKDVSDEKDYRDMDLSELQRERDKLMARLLEENRGH